MKEGDWTHPDGWQKLEEKETYGRFQRGNFIGVVRFEDTNVSKSSVKRQTVLSKR